MVHIYQNLLPPWISKISFKQIYSTDKEKAELAIMLSRRNVEEGTGGPFGAALFGESGELISVGINRVVPLQNAFLHAEFVCLSEALERFGEYALPKDRIFTLASSSQPCAMCNGALIWAGVRRLIVSASKDDTETHTGFDEGPIHPLWEKELEARGIEVCTNILSEEACEVLKLYTSKGGKIYNGR